MQNIENLVNSVSEDANPEASIFRSFPQNIPASNSELPLMNSLSLGFVYATGLSWLLCEVCVSASNGNWLPLILYTVGFTIMFSVLGCVKISDKAVEASGPVFSVIIGVGLALYGMGSFDASLVGSLLRLIGGAFMILLGVFGYLVTSKRAAH